MSHIEHRQGNLLDAEAEALVNTVNTVGVMGKGIALQFKKAFPKNFDAYKQACDAGQVVPGRMFVFATDQLTSPRWIINFPTKRHWRGKTRLEDLDAGLVDLAKVIQDLGIRSIAVPPLGCGNGGLSWNLVKPRIEDSLAPLSGVRVMLYAPVGPPDPKRQRVKPKRRRMSPARATFILALTAYRSDPASSITRLVVQKLAYLLQSASVPLNLEFVKGKYGPYAEAVNFVLQDMEGHYIHGYGDRTGPSDIEVVPEAAAKARTYLKSNPELEHALDRVQQLIEGFESPFGLELLTTVHWAATFGEVRTAEAAREYVAEWSIRKSEVFQLHHVDAAWRRLDQEGWLPPGLPTPAA